jgi:hypothetical protein
MQTRLYLPGYIDCYPGWPGLVETRGDKHQYCFIVILYCSSPSVIRIKRGRGGTDYQGIHATEGKRFGVGNTEKTHSMPKYRSLKGITVPKSI